MEQQNEELSLATKVKIVGSMALVTALIVVSTVGVVTYQRSAKVEAAELAKTQLANVEAIKTSFPDYRDTEEFKERKEMAITKISVDDLPDTITVDSVYLACQIDPISSGGFEFPGSWVIEKDGNMIAYYKSAYFEPIEPEDSTHKNGWEAQKGQVSIPVTASYGKYTMRYTTDEPCIPSGETEPVEGSASVYTHEFKITPPCPTFTATVNNP